MELKLIAADLDGTLLNNDSVLTPATQRVLQRAHDSGIKIVIATGRAADTLPESVKNCQCIDYAITSNGAAILDTRRNCLLKDTVIRKYSAKALIDYALEHHLGLEMFSGGKAYGEAYYFDHPDAFGFDEKRKHYLYSTRTKITNLDLFVAERLEQLESIAFLLKEPAMQKEIKHRFCKDESLYITSSHPRILEFSSCECGKGKALDFLLRKEALSAENLIAFGNAENDFEMMHMAAIGVATANSPEAVILQADAVCESCDADGVAKFLQTLLYGE